MDRSVFPGIKSFTKLDLYSVVPRSTPWLRMRFIDNHRVYTRLTFSFQIIVLELFSPPYSLGDLNINQ